MGLQLYLPKRMFFVSLCDYNPELPKCKQTVIAKKNVSFPFEIRLTYNLRPVMLSLSAEIIRKCMSIDISFSFTYHTEHEAVQFMTRDVEIN